MKKNLPLAVSACGMLALAVNSSAALAVDGTSQLVLEEVIVTAQKREQSIQDVPASIAAVQGDSLDRTNTSDFTDLGKITSGIAINTNSAGTFPTIRIRGVGSNRFTPAISSSVTVFMNDIPLTSPEAAFNNLADVQRIEVLKGPQSTLFGKSVSSGAFSIYTNPPQTESMEGFVEANVGENNLQEYRGALNLPLTESLAVRGVAYTTEKDGELKNLYTGKEENTDAQGVRLDLLAELGDDFSAILGYEKHDKTAKDLAQDLSDYGILTEQVAAAEGISLPPEDPHDDKTYLLLPTNTDVDTEIWSLRANWDLANKLSLSSVTSYQEWSADSDVSSSSTPLNGLLNTNFVGTETFTQELRFSYSGERLSSVFGVFYAETDREVFVSVANGAFYNPFLGGLVYMAIEIPQDETIEDLAFFSHNIVSLTESLDLTVGVRYQETEKDAVMGQRFGLGQFAHLHAPIFGVNTFDNPRQTDSWDAVTGTLKLTYHLDSHITLYGGYDRGFKAGGFNSAKPVSPVSNLDQFLLNAPFDEQTADNVEIGVKSELFDRRLRLNASVYVQRYNDFQVDVPDELGPGSVIVNAAEVVSQGVEADFIWLASEAWMIDGSVSYVDASWDKFDNAPCNAQQLQGLQTGCVDGIQDLSGERFHGNSEWTANLNATWTKNFANGLQWFVRGEVAYKGDMIGLVDHDQRALEDAYTLFNASAGVTAEAWELTLWGKNLGDKDYTTLYDLARDGNIAAGTTGVTHTPAQGRTLGLKLKYHF